MSILSFKDLSYSYNQKNTVLKGLSAELELGKIYAILGSSGCGKTTLLSLLGGLDSPTKREPSFFMEKILRRKDLPTTGAIMWPLFFRRII